MLRICASVRPCVCAYTRALKRAESHCGYHLCHLIAPLVMDPNIRRLLRQLCSDGDRLFSSVHVAANKSAQLQGGKKKGRKKKKHTRKSKPPLCCDKKIPYKSSCTFKLENKELLTRPRLQFDGFDGGADASCSLSS